MLKFIGNIAHFLQIDPRIFELKEEVEFYQSIFWGAVIVIALLILVIVLQRYLISGMKKGKQPLKLREKLSPKKILKRKEKKSKLKNVVSASSSSVSPKDLPDPGIIFKYSLAKEHVKDKLVSIGQTEGNIKTFSTEVIDDHLTVLIRIVENRRDQDIYNLPDKIVEKYQLDLRRYGKVLIYYPGLEGFREMGSRERIYLQAEPDEAGDPTFPEIPAKQPVRFRIGDRLNQDGKFVNGYFEFHLFTQSYEAKTKAGIPKVEKNFLIRLYKIYPGYDTGAINEDGLYPMVDPFTTA